MFILGKKMKTGRNREEAGNNPLIYEAKGIFEIIQFVQAGKIQGAELGSRLRKLIVIWFMENQFETTTLQIAELIGTTTQNVSKLKKKILRESAWQIRGLDVVRLATETTQLGVQIQKRMLKAGQLAEAWKVQVDMVKILQSFGFVTKAPQEIKVQAAILGKIDHEIKQKGVKAIAAIFGNIGKTVEGGGGDGGNGRPELPAHDAGESEAAGD